MTLSPSSIQIRPEEPKPVLLTIKSSANLDAKISLWADENEDLKLEFNPANITLPLSGFGGSSLDVESLVTPGKSQTYPITIHVDVTLLPPLHPEANTSYNIYGPALITEDIPLQTILPSLSWQEHLKNFTNLWITPVSTMWSFFGGVAVVLVLLIARWYDKRRKRNAGNEQPDKVES